MLQLSLKLSRNRFIISASYTFTLNGFALIKTSEMEAVLQIMAETK